VARYPYPKSAILPLAHLAQDEEGWLTNEAMEEIAELTGVTAAEVLGTCSFYTMFKRRPCGRLVVSVCTNVTCLVTGGPEIFEHLESRYAVDPDVTVEEVECIAACGGAPALQVNYEFHENVTPATAEEIVEEYKSGARTPRTVSGASVA
jgi:NADH-quinone oxidoreductase subunit E